MPSVDAEHIGDPLVIIASSTESADFSNIRFGEFVGSGLASRLPTFVDHIANVVVICPEKQVVRANTFAIVATMENVEIVRNSVVGKFPCDTMGRCDLVFADANHAVAVGPERALPLPTIPSLLDLLPESFRDGARPESIGTRRATEPFIDTPAWSESHSATATKQNWIGILGTHFWSLLNRFRGVVPRAVSSSASAFACLYFTRNSAGMGALNV